MTTRKLLPLAATLLMLACGPGKTGAGDDGADIPEIPENRSHCYLLVSRGAPLVNDTGLAPGAVDTLYIRMDVLGELVNGTFNWLPQEKDSKRGSFKGTLENGVVTALYTYKAEGVAAKEEVLFKLVDGGLRVGHGELVLDQGVWLFKDKGHAQYGDLVPEVDCP